MNPLRYLILIMILFFIQAIGITTEISGSQVGITLALKKQQLERLNADLHVQLADAGSLNSIRNRSSYLVPTTHVVYIQPDLSPIDVRTGAQLPACRGCH